MQPHEECPRCGGRIALRREVNSLGFENQLACGLCGWAMLIPDGATDRKEAAAELVRLQAARREGVSTPPRPHLRVVPKPGPILSDREFAAVVRVGAVREPPSTLPTSTPPRSIIKPAKPYTPRIVKGFKKKKWQFTPEQDARIREIYAAGTGRGFNSVNALADEMGLPRWVVSRRARDIEAYQPRIKEPVWSGVELALLRLHAHKTPANIRKAFTEAGFTRSIPGIMLKRKRLGMRADLDGYSATALAKLFNIDSHCITGWIAAGLLIAEHRGTARTIQQGGDGWYIRKQDIRNFIIAEIGIIDIRKCDKYWLVEILTYAGAASEPPECHPSPIIIPRQAGRQAGRQVLSPSP